MAEQQKTHILDDLPTDVDALDFSPYVNTLVDIITSPQTQTPLTVGVFGTWGSGKTSLMRMVNKQLPKSFRASWFDAWMYSREEDIWRTFLLHVLGTLKDALPKEKTADLDKLTDLEDALYQPVDHEGKTGDLTIEWGKLGKGVAESAVQVGLAFLPGGTTLNDLLKELRKAEKSEEAIGKIVSAFHRERTRVHIDQIRLLEQFQQHFGELAEEYLIKKNLRLVVFIDDLDRCLPEKAVDILEAIKVFVDTPGCIFVIGMDQEVIAHGVEVKYRDLSLQTPSEDGQPHSMINGGRYLEKIIQLPFQIPPISQTDLGKFVRGLMDNWPHKDCPLVFAEAFNNNPRQIKRTVNLFMMLWQLAQKRSAKTQNLIKPLRLAKVVAIQGLYPELYQLLKETPRYLSDLEVYYRARYAGETNIEWDPKQSLAQLPPALAPYVNRETIRHILVMNPPKTPDANFTELKPDELRVYFTLAQRAESVHIGPKQLAYQIFEPQLMRIPAGPFLMGSSPNQIVNITDEMLETERLRRERPQHIVELSEYFIGKYPVTNREYQLFVIDSGFPPPPGWNANQYAEEKGDHPVVNISWEAAVAYCKWLSEKTNKQFRLPTEAEWEKAARGVDGRIYPWGNQFSANYCNTSEAGIQDTTPVGQFSPHGDSPFGCADMAGNILEWCADWYNEEEYIGRAEKSVKDPQGPETGTYRALRGGSFVLNQWNARCAVRFRLNPQFWFDFGFRVVV